MERDNIIKNRNSIPKMGEIRYGYNENPENHKYGGIRPYLIVSNNVYNKTSGLVEAIPFTTKRLNSENPVHIQYKAEEVQGLTKDSTLMIESRVTLSCQRFTEPIGHFTQENWTKAAVGMAYQNPCVIYAFNQRQIQQNTLFNNLLKNS